MRPTIKIKPMPWTEDRVDMLKGLWKDGLSCAQIARQIGGVSRCAVIGKAHRLNLETRAVEYRKRDKHSSGGSQRGKPRQYRTRDRLFIVNADTGAITDIRSLENEPKPITQADGSLIGVLHIGKGQCRWPHGSAREAGFHFCANQVVADSPYCAHHGARAWQPKQKTPGEKLDIRMSAFALRAREAA